MARNPLLGFADTYISATLGAPATAILTITDDDPAPTVQFAQASMTANEGSGAVIVTVSLSAPLGKFVTVNYASSNGSATQGEDYAAVSGTLPFAPGTVQQSVEVTVLDDALVEGDETVTLTLGNPGNVVYGAEFSTTLTIPITRSPAPTSLCHMIMR